MSTEKFTYTKDDGEVSERKLIVVAKVPAQNIRALDVSAFDDETAEKIAFVYDEWIEKVKKPFDKLARQFLKDNLVEFEEYLDGAGICEKQKAMLKSFKASGLEKADA